MVCRPCGSATGPARRGSSVPGFTVVDPATALSTHLSETIRSFLPDLLTRQQTKDLIDRVGQTSPKLIEELVPKLVSIGEVQRVLRQLLRERVPVQATSRPFSKAMADAAGAASKDPDAMTEAVRVALGPVDLPNRIQTEPGDLRAISMIAPPLEDELIGSLTRTDRGAVLAMDPNRAQSLASKLAEILGAEVAQPVLLCSPVLRPHLWRLFARALPHVAVLSSLGELPPQVRVMSVATFELTCI